MKPQIPWLSVFVEAVVKKCLAVTPILLVVLGCSSDGVPVESVVVRDSAGVGIVENLAPAWADGLSGWTVDPIPQIEIRGDFEEPEHYLFDVQDVVRVSNGSIVVANRGTSQLFLFDSLGAFVGVEGGPGDGPGEFEGLYGLFRCGQDTLLVMERSRISLWDGAGQFLRTMPIREQFTAVSPDCSAGLSSANVLRPPLLPGLFDLEVNLFWRAFEDDATDTITTAVWGQGYFWERDGTLMDPWLPFAEAAVWAASGDDAIVGHGVSFELEVFERSGRLRRLIRWEATRSPLTRQDRDDLSRTLLERPEDEADWYGPVERMPLPDAKPAYTRILSGGEGSVWVQQAGKWPEHSKEWWLFDSGGRWLGAVEMPANLRVLAIDDDFVIGVFLDEFDVENVRLHRINKEISP